MRWWTYFLFVLPDQHLLVINYHSLQEIFRAGHFLEGQPLRVFSLFTLCFLCSFPHTLNTTHIEFGLSLQLFVYLFFDPVDHLFFMKTFACCWADFNCFRFTHWLSQLVCSLLLLFRFYVEITHCVSFPFDTYKNSLEFISNGLSHYWLFCLGKTCRSSKQVLYI